MKDWVLFCYYVGGVKAGGVCWSDWVKSYPSSRIVCFVSIWIFTDWPWIFWLSFTAPTDALAVFEEGRLLTLILFVWIPLGSIPLFEEGRLVALTLFIEIPFGSVPNV